MNAQKESRLRSLIKAISWRIVATATIIAIAYFTTGDIKIAVTIGVLEFFIKLALYYVHERAWQTVPKGKIREIIRIK